MEINYSEQIFQSIDTIVSQKLNEVQFDRTEICEVISQDKNNKYKYLVSNGSLKYEAYSTDKNRKYLANQKVYVTIPQGNYDLRKLIIGNYNADETNENLYVNPFNQLVTSSTLPLPNSIWAKVNDKEYDEWDDTPSDKEKPNSVEFLTDFKYNNTQDFDYIGLDFSFNTNIIGYQGSYALRLSFWNGEEELTNVDDNTLIISSKDLYGNPYNLNETLSFQHLFPWPKRERDGRLEPISPTEVTKIELQLIQDNKFLTRQGEANVNANTWIQLVKADLKFGYDVTSVTEDKLELILKKGESLRYTTGDENVLLEDETPAVARNLYLNWNHTDTSGAIHIFNINQLPNIFEYYNVYWLHYVDGSGTNGILPDDKGWNWEIIEPNFLIANQLFTRTIYLFTQYKTDQYKVVIEYKYKDNETVYYAESTGLIFENTQVTAEPGATNSSEDSLRLRLDKGDTGVYNIYGLDSRMMDLSYKGPHNIQFEFLDKTPLEKIKTVEWKFPSDNTMIKDVSNINQQSATFYIDTQYKPGAMNNRIQCQVTLNTGEIRRGSLTLQFGEAAAAGSNYAFNIDFVGHRTCVYATGKEDSVEIEATFTKQNGEVMTVPTITWSWANDYDSLITLSNSTGEKITLTYNSGEVPKENYSILQAEINDYAIDNGLTTKLTAYLPIPIAKPEYNYISGATRVVYDSNGNTATYSKNPYELYNLTNKIENTFWDIISNSTNDTFQLKTQNVRDENGNKTGEEKTLLPLSYIPQEPPATCVYCMLNEEIVWSQPILIIQNRWEYDLLNEWNGKLNINDQDGYVLAPLLGAGKKEDNSFTGVLMGDLRTAKGKLSETGLYGFKNGSRRFSFNDKGEAYIGTGDYYIDFDSEVLKISSKIFDLNSDHIEINTDGLIIKGGNFVVQNTSGKNVLFFDSDTKNLMFKGLITDGDEGTAELNGGRLNLVGNNIEWFEVWPSKSDKNCMVSGRNGIRFTDTVDSQNNQLASFTKDGCVLYANQYKCLETTSDGGSMYGKWNLKTSQCFTGNVRTPNSLAICRSSSAITTYDLHLWVNSSHNGIIDAPNGNLSLCSQSAAKLEANSSGGALYGTWTCDKLKLSTGGSIFKKHQDKFADSMFYSYPIFSFFPYQNFEGDKLGIWNDKVHGTCGALNLVASGGLLCGAWSYNGVGIATTGSDIKIKHDIYPLNNKYNNLFDDLEPVSFIYNPNEYGYGTSQRTHLGFIANKVEAAMQKNNISNMEFAGLVIQNMGTENELYTLRYEEFIALNTWQIQNLKTRVTELEKEIKELKNEI